MSLTIAFALALAAPPAGSCQAALGPLYDGTDEAQLPGRVDGTTIASAEALVALRRERADALITVAGGNFAGARLGGERLHNICFIESNLAGSDWAGAEANGVGFVRANVARANFAGAKMRGILLREADMSGVDGTGADFAGGKADGGWNGSFGDTKFDRANLTGFAFDCGITIGDGCPLERGISLRGANLTGANFSGFWIDGDVQGARVDRTRLSLAQLTSFKTAAVEGPILVDGGEADVALSPAEYRSLVPAIRESWRTETPSFSCARAATPVERILCAADAASLRSADRELADLYRQAMVRQPDVATSQRAWLRERDGCAAKPAEEREGCIAEAYDRRRSQLITALGPADWVRPGTVALFVDPQVEFEEGFRQTPLYRRLLPALKGSASARIIVRVNADGSLDAAGDAVGSNAHLCSLAAERIRLDPATGWFSAPDRPEIEAPPEWRGKPIPVLRLFGDRAEVWRGGKGGYGEGEDPRVSDFASCGVRAYFPELIRVPVTPAEAQKLLDTYKEQ